jgi:hypothetical protein
MWRTVVKDVARAQSKELGLNNVLVGRSPLRGAAVPQAARSAD